MIVHLHQPSPLSKINFEWITMFMLTCLWTATDRACSADINLALRKNSSSSPTWFPSSNAVDGDPSTFAEMVTQYPAWWMVDLNGPKFINRVRLSNRKDCCADRLQKVTILLSLTGQTNPSLTSMEWTRVFYQSSAFGGLGSVKEIILEPSLARFLAVVSEYDGPNYAVSIAEVEVHGILQYSCCLFSSTVQSSTFNSSYNASLAFDGSLDTFPSRTEALPRQWWKGIFPSAVLLSSVVFYSADPDQCNGCSCGSLTPHLIVLTSAYVTSQEPAQGISAWTEFDGALVDNPDGSISFCEKNGFTYIKQLAILNNDTNAGVNLKEIIVYIKSAPVLTPVNVFSSEATYDSVQYSFSKWTNNLPGDIEPDRYIISWNVTSVDTGSISIPHPKDSSPIVVNVTNLVPGTFYKFMIICLVKGIAPEFGDKTNLTTISTMPCSAPSDPVLTISWENEIIGTRKRNKLDISWQVSRINCATLKEYTVTLSKANTQPTMVSTVNKHTEFRDLEAYTEYTVSVTAENSIGQRAYTRETERSPELEPYDFPSDFEVSAINGSCIQLSWREPNSANGVITNYMSNCSYEADSNITGEVEAAIQQLVWCNFTSASKVTCQIRARNTAGFGPLTNPQSVYTPVEVIHFPVLCDANCGDLIDGKLELTISPVQLKNPTARILAYILIVKDESQETLRQRRTSEEIDALNLFNISEANHWSISYYVTAELNATLISDEYRFTLGDGNLYGGYYNAPLAEGKMFSIWNGIRLKLGNEIVMINGQGSSTFTVPHRGLPPLVPVVDLAIIIGSLFGVLALIAAIAGVAILLIRKRRHPKQSLYASQPLEPASVDTGTEENAVSSKHTSDDQQRTVLPSQARLQNVSGGEGNAMMYQNISISKKPDRIMQSTGSDNSASGMNVQTKQTSPDEVRTSKQSPVSHSYEEISLEPKAKLTHPYSVLRLDTQSHNGANVESHAADMTEVKQLAGNTLLSKDGKPLVAARKSKFSSKTTNSYNAGMQESEPIPVDQMEWYTQNNKDLIDAQFTKLGQLPVGDMKVAALPENKGKSRYKGLYPVDQYRVILQRSLSEGTDYINASHIQGYKKKTLFIAAQGPTDSTTVDFWFMIWQEKPSAVVMVTNLYEDGKMKCNQYWPDDGGPEVKFGDVFVECFCEENWADFTVRTLKVTKKGDQRILKQFHYRTWPDHGVPKEINPFLLFYLRVQSYISSRSGPLLIHCSAGVGRTGTFISLSYLLEQAAADKVVDPFHCVKRLRERRPNLVQAKEQYTFLHLVLREALLTQGFMAAPDVIDQRINAITVKDRTFDMITQEFECIEKRLREQEFEYVTARESTNQAKNRDSEILPCEDHRVVITSSADAYINAVFVNGVREKDHMIATQLPLTNTIGDFWNMVLQYGCHSIVQMQHCNVEYFPQQAGSSMNVGETELKCCEVQAGQFFTTRCIEILTQNNKRVQHFEMNAAICSSPESLLSVFDAVESWQQQKGSHRILVCCLNGAAKCGDFICSVNALSNFKVDQSVDVYNSVLLARLRRPQFVASFEQYLNIYRLLKTYRDSFSTYANFN